MTELFENIRDFLGAISPGPDAQWPAPRISEPPPELRNDLPAMTGIQGFRQPIRAPVDHRPRRPGMYRGRLSTPRAIGWHA